MEEWRWAAVDGYIAEHLIGPDPAMDEVLAANARAGLPPHDVSPPQGKLLYLLACIVGARRILEIGTLGGYSTIWLARALPPDGSIVTLELEERCASVALENFDRAGFADRISLRTGPALECLPELEQEGGQPFDLVFIDADKQNSARYLAYALKLTRIGGVIIADNVVRDGAIIDPISGDPRVEGVRAFYELAAGEPRLQGTAIQTVGSKGWDGFAIVIVSSASN